MMVGSTHARRTHATILLFSWPALSPPPPSCLPETSMPTLWVDADACPRVARDIIVRAAAPTATPAWFVANYAVPLPPSPWVKGLAVSQGFAAADAAIGERIRPRALLTTSSLPCAWAATAPRA